MEKKKGRIKSFLKTLVKFIANPRLMLCLGIAWLITNGWSYVMLGVGTCLGIEWMIAVGGAYLTFLWLPISPEKILTVIIAIGLLRLLFPNDERTLGILKGLHAKYKLRHEKKRAKRGKKSGEGEKSVPASEKKEEKGEKSDGDPLDIS